MARWTLMPANKKSIEEVMLWEKDGKTIVYRLGWRSGSVTIATVDETPPKIDLEGNDKIEVFSLYDDNILEIELDCFWDICWHDWEMDGLSDQEKEEIIAAWELYSYEGVEALGWEQTETETYFYGPLVLERYDPK